MFQNVVDYRLCALYYLSMNLVGLYFWIQIVLTLSLFPLDLSLPYVELLPDEPPGPGTYSPFLTRCPSSELIRKADWV